MKLVVLETPLFTRLLGDYLAGERKALKKAIQTELEARRRKP
jgi:hypothetical protein